MGDKKIARTMMNTTSVGKWRDKPRASENGDNEAATRQQWLKQREQDH